MNSVVVETTEETVTVEIGSHVVIEEPMEIGNIEIRYHSSTTGKVDERSSWLQINDLKSWRTFFVIHVSKGERIYHDQRDDLMLW